MNKLLFLIITGLLLLSSAVAQDYTNVPETDRVFTNGSFVSTISLAELEQKYIYILDPYAFTNDNAIKTDYYRLIMDLVSRTNVGALRVLEKAWKLDIKSDEKLIKYQPRIMKRLRSESAKRSELTSKALIVRRPSGDIVLRNADYIESVMVRKHGVEERMVTIRGKVEILVDNNVIHANSLTINMDTKDVYAEGDLSIKSSDINGRGDKMILNTDDSSGILFGFFGVVDQSINVQGGVLKINNEDHITLENGIATFSSNEKPHYYFKSKNFDFQDKGRLMADRLVFFVHNHPFFALPFVVQEPFGTRIELKAGRTIREGFYLENSFGFKVPFFDKVGTRFNFYEKTGVYLGMNNNLRNMMKTKLAYSRYYENEYLDGATANRWGNNIRDDNYNSGFNEYFDREVASDRYKVELDYNVPLVKLLSKQGGSAYQNRLIMQLKKTSDPFFTDNLERSLPEFDIFQDIFQELDEPLYRQRPTDNERFYLELYQSLHQSTTVRLSAAWNYGNFSKQFNDATLKDDWDSVLVTKVLPRIQFSQSGAIDPKRSTNTTRKHFANINYNANVQFHSTEYYSNVHPYGFMRDQNVFNISGGLNRSFKLDKLGEDRELKSMDFSWVPQFTLAYNKQWGGEKLSKSIIDNNLSATRLGFSYNNSFSMNIPSAKVQNKLNRSYGFLPMIPTASISASYNLNWADTMLDDHKIKLKFGTNYDKGVMSRDFGVNLRVKHNGYGLFFIRGLDYTFGYNNSFGYNLKPLFDRDNPSIRVRPDADPEKDNTTNYYRIDDRQKANEWYYRTRIRNLNGNMSLNLNFRSIVTMNNSLNWTYYDRVNTNYYHWKNVFDTYNMSFGIKGGQKKSTNRFFRMNNINLAYSWNSYLREDRYLNDRMSFSLNMQFSITPTITFDVGMSSSARSVYYSSRKLKKLYPENNQWTNLHRNFFADLWNSIWPFEKADSGGVKVSDDWQNALFKLGSLNLSMYHDLDNWYLKLAYSIRPVAFASHGSLKGYYYDHKFSFEINIKKELKKDLKLDMPDVDVDESYTPPAFIRPKTY